MIEQNSIKYANGAFSRQMLPNSNKLNAKPGRVRSIEPVIHRAILNYRQSELFYSIAASASFWITLSVSDLNLQKRLSLAKLSPLSPSYRFIAASVSFWITVSVFVAMMTSLCSSVFLFFRYGLPKFIVIFSSKSSYPIFLKLLYFSNSFIIGTGSVWLLLG